MTPIRRVTFLDDQGRPIRVAPSRLTPLEREVQASSQQDHMLDFEESRAPAPAAATVHHTILPAPVGAAQELTRLRRSNDLRQPRRRRRSARRRSVRKASRPKRRTAPRRTASRRRAATSRARRPASGTRRAPSRRNRTATRTRTRRTTRRSTVSRR